MAVFLKAMCVLWYIGGGLLLLGGLALRPANILQQQFVTGQLIMAVVLLSFGTLFAFAAWMCGRVDRALRLAADGR